MEVKPILTPRVEVFKFGVLQNDPCPKICIKLLEKLVKFLNEKGSHSTLTLRSWMTLSKYKLKLRNDLAWLYFRIYNILLHQADLDIASTKEGGFQGGWDIQCERLRRNFTSGFSVAEAGNHTRDEFSIHKSSFLLFLYLQNLRALRSKVTEVNGSKNYQDLVEFLKENLEKMLEFLEPSSNSERISLDTVSALNVVLKVNVRSGEMKIGLEGLVLEKSGLGVDLDMTSMTLDRKLFIEWVKGSLGDLSRISSKVEVTSGSWRNDLPSQIWISWIGNGMDEREVSIVDLSDRVIRLESLPEWSNLKISGCKNCYFYLPGLFKSVTMDNCSNVMFYLGVVTSLLKVSSCRDIRVHSVARMPIFKGLHRAILFLHTPNRPVLLGNRNQKVLVAPYNTWYPTLDNHMKSGSIYLRLNKWDNPLAIGNDGFVLLKTDSWTRMTPKCFNRVRYPFRMPGLTPSNPLPLPAAFSEEVKNKEMRVREVIKSISNLEERSRPIVVQTLLIRFRTWLKKMGLDRKLEGLRSLEGNLEPPLTIMPSALRSLTSFPRGLSRERPFSGLGGGDGGIETSEGDSPIDYNDYEDASGVDGDNEISD